MDANGSVINGITSFPENGAGLEESLSSMLRLGGNDALAALRGEKPLAPHFTAARMDGDGSFVFADHIGKPMIVMFFLHTCGHCHDAPPGHPSGARSAAGSLSPDPGRHLGRQPADVGHGAVEGRRPRLLHGAL